MKERGVGRVRCVIYDVAIFHGKADEPERL